MLWYRQTPSHTVNITKHNYSSSDVKQKSEKISARHCIIYYYIILHAGKYLYLYVYCICICLIDNITAERRRNECEPEGFWRDNFYFFVLMNYIHTYTLGGHYYYSNARRISIRVYIYNNIIYNIVDLLKSPVTRETAAATYRLLQHGW